MNAPIAMEIFSPEGPVSFPEMTDGFDVVAAWHCARCGCHAYFLANREGRPGYEARARASQSAHYEKHRAFEKNTPWWKQIWPGFEP